MDKATFLRRAAVLQTDYSPSASLKQQLSSLVLAAFVGPTGVGKTTLMEACNLPHIYSDVTRATRPGEVDGREYFFRTDFGKMLAEIKAGQYAQFVINSNGEFYGTRGVNYPLSGLCSMAIIAEVIPKFRGLGFKQIIPLYILPPNYDEWMRRIGENRNTDLAPRLKEASQSLLIALSDPVYNFILNDKIENAARDVEAIVAGNQISKERVLLARRVAEELETRVVSTLS